MYSIFVSLLLILNGSLNLFSAQEIMQCNSKVASWRDDDAEDESIFEGFCAGTLVKTPSGYVPIEQLYSGEYVLDHEGQLKKIEGIALKRVPCSLRVKVGDAYLTCGVHQLFRNSPCEWLTITETNHVATRNESCIALYNFALIEEETWLYTLTVEDHVFCVTEKDLVVHNAEALIVGAVGIVLEHFAIAPAVISAVQTTVSLTFISYQALQDYTAQQEILKKPFNEQECCQKTRRAERDYFEKRKQELEKLRDEFLFVKNEAYMIRGAYASGATFTSLFFNQQTLVHAVDPANLMLMNEIQLPQEAYEKLRLARDIYLQNLEDEISDLHLMIALHLNEGIEQVKKACADHLRITTESNPSIDRWNQLRYGTIPVDFLFQHYERLLIDYASYEKVRASMEELRAILNFYSNHRNRSAIAKTIPLEHLIEKTIPWLTQQEAALEKDRIRIHNNIVAVESYYERNGIYRAHVRPQTKAAFEKQYEEKRKLQLLALKQKYENLKKRYKETKKTDGGDDGKGPQKPRNEDKYENMYEVFARAPLGKKLKEVIKDASRRYKETKMYRVIKDAKEWGIQKDDWLYLDMKHKDHIEVFTKRGTPLRTILNMDGTQNLAKIEQAGKRTIESWIK